MDTKPVRRMGRFKGRKEFLLHLSGHTLTAKGSILAKCYECMGGYADGAADCQLPSCPLYPRMPYATRINLAVARPPKTGAASKEQPRKDKRCRQ